MQCNDCRYYLISPNDYYGVCKRYPENQNKNKTDFCGEFSRKFEPIESKFTELVEVTEDNKVKIVFEEEKPKRGRKPKNVD